MLVADAEVEAVAPSRRARWTGRVGPALRFLLPRALPLLGRRTLVALGRVLAVEHLPERCDVLAVLGGGGGERARHAADLYARLRPPSVILFTDIARERLRVAGVGSSVELLLRGGVPADAITRVTDVATTWDEALWLRRASRSGAVMVVTDWYHSRRAYLTISRALRETGTRVRVCPVSGDRAVGWWATPEESMQVVGEFAALLLYRLLGRT